MANTITGRVLHIYPAETVTGKNNSITKRSLLMDCTRFDPYTGERGIENTPLLEFVGDKCAELDNFQRGQIVTVTFDVQGTKYTNREGVENIFTRVRPYKIEARQGKPAAQPAAPQQAEQVHNNPPAFPPQDDGLPF